MGPREALFRREFAFSGVCSSRASVSASAPVPALAAAAAAVSAVIVVVGRSKGEGSWMGGGRCELVREEGRLDLSVDWERKPEGEVGDIEMVGSAAAAELGRRINGAAAADDDDSEEGDDE